MSFAKCIIHDVKICVKIINKTNNLINVNRDNVVNFNKFIKTDVVSVNFFKMFKKNIFELKFN